MSSSECVRIPMLSQLIPGGIKPGTIFAVEFDPQSQWFAVATTIAARYLQANGRVVYVAQARPIEDVKHDLAALGIDVAAVQSEGRLAVDDQYSATLTGGRLLSENAKSGVFEPIEGGVRFRSLKIADLSVEFLKQSKHGPAPWDYIEAWPPGALLVVESGTEMLRFNEEVPFAEWMASRYNPSERRAKRITLQGFARGIHSESFYRRIENASDGLIEIRIMERGEDLKNLLRVSSLRGQPHDARWHEIEVKPNGEAILTI